MASIHLTSNACEVINAPSYSVNVCGVVSSLIGPARHLALQLTESGAWHTRKVQIMGQFSPRARSTGAASEKGARMTFQGVVLADVPQHLGVQYRDCRLNGTLTVPRG